MILKDPPAVDKCGKCGSNGETIQHILNGCAQLVTSEYKNRHDAVGRILHQEIMKRIVGESQGMPYYKYDPESTVETDCYRIYWDRTVRTDREAIHNRPDIIVFNKLNKTAQLIDVALPSTHNVKSTYEKKKRKYVEVSKEIRKI